MTQKKREPHYWILVEDTEGDIFWSTWSGGGRKVRGSELHVVSEDESEYLREAYTAADADEKLRLFGARSDVTLVEKHLVFQPNKDAGWQLRSDYPALTSFDVLSKGIAELLNIPQTSTTAEMLEALAKALPKKTPPNELEGFRVGDLVASNPSGTSAWGKISRLEHPFAAVAYPDHAEPYQQEITRLHRKPVEVGDMVRHQLPGHVSGKVTRVWKNEIGIKMVEFEKDGFARFEHCIAIAKERKTND